MNTICISSTKGGVGKSTVTWGIATTLSQRGYRVGMVGADLEGDALGYMAGLSFDKLMGNEFIEPITVEGIKMISLSLFLEPEFLDAPIMLGEERKNQIISQLKTAINWGELDILVIDSPPTLGEEAKGIIKYLKPDGYIMVTLPQKISALPVRRMIKMVRDIYKIPVLGIVENDAYNIGGSSGEEISEMTGIPLLAKISWNKGIAEAMDNGKGIPQNEHFDTIADTIEQEYLTPAKTAQETMEEVSPAESMLPEEHEETTEEVKEEAGEPAGDTSSTEDKKSLDDKVMELRAQGMTMPQIAKELGENRGKIMAVLKRLEKPKRKGA